MVHGASLDAVTCSDRAEFENKLQRDSLSFPGLRLASVTPPMMNVPSCRTLTFSLGCFQAVVREATTAWIKWQPVISSSNTPAVPQEAASRGPGRARAGRRTPARVLPAQQVDLADELVIEDADLAIED